MLQKFATLIKSKYRRLSLDLGRNGFLARLVLGMMPGFCVIVIRVISLRY